MKKDKNGLLHDDSGRFAPKVKMENIPYVRLRMTDKLDIAAFTLGAVFLGCVVYKGMGDALIEALRALWLY